MTLSNQRYARLATLTVAALAALLTGCANLAPSQGTPAAAIPTAWPASAASAAAQASAPQAADIG